MTDTTTPAAARIIGLEYGFDLLTAYADMEARDVDARIALFTEGAEGAAVVSATTRSTYVLPVPVAFAHNGDVYATTTLFVDTEYRWANDTDDDYTATVVADAYRIGPDGAPDGRNRHIELPPEIAAILDVITSYDDTDPDDPGYDPADGDGCRYHECCGITYDPDDTVDLDPDPDAPCYDDYCLDYCAGSADCAAQETGPAAAHGDDPLAEVIVSLRTRKDPAGDTAKDAARHAAAVEAFIAAVCDSFAPRLEAAVGSQLNATILPL